MHTVKKDNTFHIAVLLTTNASVCLSKCLYPSFATLMNNRNSNKYWCQCWLVVNWALWITILWNSYQNIKISIQENAIQNVICKTKSIFFGFIILIWELENRSSEISNYNNEWLTHWDRVTHICVGNLTIIGSDNGLSPGRRQAITWTDVGILLTGHLGTNFSEILIEIHTFSFKKIHLKMSSGKWRPFCLGLNVLINGDNICPIRRRRRSVKIKVLVVSTPS